MKQLKQFSMIRQYLFLISVFGLVLGTLLLAPPAVQAIGNGAVVKGEGDSLYYLSNGQRYVFPNEKTYRSWFSDFSQVRQISQAELISIPLKGNVTYRPGVLLVKITTDPKVYAVGADGQLRWITSERLARVLYGDHWNLLIDDVPDAFFINYAVGEQIDDEADFEPEVEAEYTESIGQNLGHLIRTKVRQEIAQTKVRLCEHLQKIINRIQDRLSRRGLTVEDLGEDLLNHCLGDDLDSDATATSTADFISGKKITICHIPPGNSAAAATIRVAKDAARVHLAHGDTVGECGASFDDQGVEALTRHGTVSGQVLLGPTCPVLKDPSDPDCADKPYQTTVQAVMINSNKMIEVETDERGNYQVKLPSGDYTLRALGATPFPRCETETITVKSGGMLKVNLSCDTGIR